MTLNIGLTTIIISILVIVVITIIIQLGQLEEDAGDGSPESVHGTQIAQRLNPFLH